MGFLIVGGRRRTLATLVGALTLPIALVGCGGTTTESGPVPERDYGTPVAGEVKADVLEGVTLTKAGSGGSLEAAMAEAYWNPFAEESSATILQDAYETGKLKAMVESGNVTWDIVGADQITTATQCGKLFEKVDPEFVDTSKVPEGLITDDCMVPMNVFGLVVVYDTDAFGDNPPTSAKDFFDTEKFPGKRTVSQSTFIDPYTAEFALLADGKDLNNLSVDDIERAFDKYRDLGDDLIGWTSGAQSQQQLESGEAVMGLVWSGVGYAAAKAGASVAPMWDEWMTIVDAFAIPKGVKDKRAVLAALNYTLGAEQQATFTELSAYAGVNVDAQPQLDELATTYVASEYLDTGITANIEFWIENYQALAAEWANWTTGS